MTVPPSLLFIFGVGYSAQRVAAQALEQGWQVCGTVRSDDKARQLGEKGIDAEVWSGEGPLNVPDGAHWLISVPPDADGCPVARVMSEAAPRAASITYLSTTGVYGDLGGGWAFEWSDLNPGSARAKRRVLAEQQWRDINTNTRLVRLPGIYGPGRSALDRVRSGKARRIIKPGQVFSRIHVEDLASGIVKLIEAPQKTGVFHLCDDAPAPPQDVITLAAGLLGVDLPAPVPFETADLSAMAASFYADCKRVSNAQTKSKLGWRPIHKSYELGLASILR
jgi:nucleoside-diphosphate-sugar epimerase